MERGTRVVIVNPKHRNYGQVGVLFNMDRGNVYVLLDSGKEICTRMVALAPSQPTPLMEFTKKLMD